MGDPRLPDPFKRLDGTRITDRSEWACRREEILRQGFKYIYGDKPIPAEGAVTGTVSDTSITVRVNEGGKSAQFNVTVDMNGATAPAPAIIYYDGGMGSPTPIPNGVAKIRFNAIEAQGGSGAKTGPFYDVYGTDHPAGYLTAQAWQISRIIDVLEQDPSIIDPYRLGLTGCSRNGKGAFVGGVLDNRIALTIPVESGIGGTVALRLVEVLDTYSGSEWPFHSISYVRWLSEVALGPFTSGNAAGQDNTDRLPVDMHEMMALIAPRGLLILDNPSGTYNGLDRNAAWVTGSVAKVAFEALGVGDAISYQGASGSHCDPNFRQPYLAPLNAMIDKFLKGNASASTGTFGTDLGNKPSPEQHYSWTAPTLTGEL
ncbi:MAG: PE PGRS family protein [Polyangiaceae bacterium]|nr:PE PGRS family protein [Polyangiaceae bacterium]